MKRKLFLLLCTLLGLLSSVQNVKADVVKTDVTDAYITNPSFENDAAEAVVTGWTAYGHSEEGLVDASSYPVTSAEDFVNKDGKKICKFYANRWTGWWSYWIIYQKVTLPAGVYEWDATIETDEGKTVSLFAMPDADLNNKDNYINKADVTGTDGNTGTKTSVTFTSNGSTPVVLGAGLVNVPSYYPFTFKVDNFKLYSLKNIDYTSLLANPNFESGDKIGWTDDSSTKDKFFVQNNDNFSKKQGTYYAERYWWDNKSDINQTTPELPAGIYRITAVAMDNAASPTFKLYAQAGSSDEVTQTVGAADDYSVEVSLKTAGTIKLGFKGTHTHEQWVAVDNFRLTYLGNPYPELKTAIETAEGYTLGFDAGEYAPYTNVDALTRLASAKSIYDAKTATYAEVVAAKEALEGATWTANTELMDAIYDGQFASYTEDELNKSFKENGIKFPGGWLHDNSAVSTTDHIRQIATFSSFEGGRAMFFHKGTVSYGQTTGYTMPLRANAVYKFSFQYAGWSGYGTNPPSISILNENNEGMALTALPEGASAPGSGSTRYTVYFATDATPGNYIFKYQSPDNTNSTIGGLSLIRVDALPFSASGSTNYLPGTYSKVSVDRPMSSGTWNTLVIPVDMAIPGEWTVKEMDNFSESTLTFKNASSIVAGTPYLVKTTETIDNIIASDVEVKALSVVNNITKNGLTMKGVYANGYVPVSDGSATRYVVSGDYMYRVNSTVSIKPFRAYFELEGGNNAREIILNFNDDFTAINAIDVAENEFGAQKDGKYLIDGKIVIVKNGVKYGTNGQKLN